LTLKNTSKLCPGTCIAKTLSSYETINFMTHSTKFAD
jgi:hypothetical protein